MQAHIKVGISAWTERTLLASGWYPPGARDAESRLRYYATRFPIVEVDATYYAVPAPHQVEIWDERTPPDFTMNVKAHALFTGHYTDARRLPRDLREWLPRLERLASKTREVHVIMNNCHRDYAVKNAAQMMELAAAADLPVTHALEEATPML